jgi:hypothetical protein
MEARRPGAEDGSGPNRIEHHRATGGSTDPPAAFKGLRAAFKGLRAAFKGLRAAFKGLRAAFKGLRAAFKGLRAGKPGGGGQGPPHTLWPRRPLAPLA